jgi:hypothetical protein
MHHATPFGWIQITAISPTTTITDDVIRDFQPLMTASILGIRTIIIDGIGRSNTVDRSEEEFQLWVRHESAGWMDRWIDDGMIMNKEAMDGWRERCVTDHFSGCATIGSSNRFSFVT